MPRLVGGKLGMLHIPFGNSKLLMPFSKMEIPHPQSFGELNFNLLFPPSGYKPPITHWGINKAISLPPFQNLGLV